MIIAKFIAQNHKTLVISFPFLSCISYKTISCVFLFHPPEANAITSKFLKDVAPNLHYNKICMSERMFRHEMNIRSVRINYRTKTDKIYTFCISLFSLFMPPDVFASDCFLCYNKMNIVCFSSLVAVPSISFGRRSLKMIIKWSKIQSWWIIW